MKGYLYGVYALIIAIVSMFTGEIVTFIMLGFILISLQNIHSTLKKILEVKQKKIVKRMLYFKKE
ncbi:hypothetical protein MPH47_20760 [Psychrobacillus psychrodurans]|nr:hypothetical protein [Psychrobacillus psychrodurans]MCK1999622.1 hypothetical protein [Psychrobacillus psychrodurans]